MILRLAPSGLLLATALFGQAVVHTGPTLLPPPNGSRFGNINFPGGTPIAAPAPRLGSLIPNHGQYGGYVSPPARSGNLGHGGRERTVVVPYAFPVYFGDYGGYGYQPQQQQPAVTVVMPQQMTPTVIINQTFVPGGSEPIDEEAPPQSQSSVRIYKTPVRSSNPEPEVALRAAAPEEKATIYLIAYKDASIHSAIGYWTEGNTLHYVTQQGTVNRISMDQVDKSLSDQLNSERKVDFQLRTQ
ncbi:MAG: hypothetical protein ABJF23_08255 [Bryobacteraceae bacterium]